MHRFAFVAFDSDATVTLTCKHHGPRSQYFPQSFFIGLSALAMTDDLEIPKKIFFKIRNDFIVFPKKFFFSYIMN